VASRGSYLAKYRENNPEEAAKRGKNIIVRISEEKRAEFAEGKVLLIDKPLHWTSFDIVRKIRNSIGIKKVGHAGTLDPLASGLLVVCTGKFTKKINEYMAAEKEYTGTITLGAVTPTYDSESDPEQFKDISGISHEKVIEATKSFIGDIMQFPPVYSAIKKDGVALYELARRGEAVDLEARPVTIKTFEITSINMPQVEFKVTCSTGTYIRSLANDFGASLGCGGYLSALRRTKIGELDVQNAQTIEDFLLSISGNDEGEDQQTKKDS